MGTQTGIPDLRHHAASATAVSYQVAGGLRSQFSLSPWPGTLATVMVGPTWGGVPFPGLNSQGSSGTPLVTVTAPAGPLPAVLQVADPSAQLSLFPGALCSRGIQDTGHSKPFHFGDEVYMVPGCERSGC
jgi:hypothetical protein